MEERCPGRDEPVDDGKEQKGTSAAAVKEFRSGV